MPSSSLINYWCTYLIKNYIFIYSLFCWKSWMKFIIFFFYFSYCNIFLFKKKLIDFKNFIKSTIWFLQSKCADCPIAWTPLSVLPEPYKIIFSFKSFESFSWIIPWIVKPFFWIYHPLKFVPTYSISNWYLGI